MGGGLAPLVVVDPKPVPKGTPEYEKARSELLSTLAIKVPDSLRLDSAILRNPPINVSTVPRSCGILTTEELAITEQYDATGLSEAISARKLTAVEVARAFSKRAIVAHQLTCCLTDWFMDDALKQAQALDDYLEQHGRTIGPLHGVPISIKEHMPIAGQRSSEGCLSSTAINERDCHLVSILRKAGAVFYCKTNQPQAIMHLECASHYGRTLNPFNIHLSSGGSSGGEAALVAMKGSVLGVGSDIGGSIRGPSAFCGIYGFKPTSDVMPLRDMLSHPLGAEINIPPSSGPMCRSLRDMDIFTKVIIDAQPWLLDPKVIPIPWTGLGTPFKRPLKIGIIDHDGFIVPQPPVVRAIAWLKERLADAACSSQIEVKSFQPFGAAQAFPMIRRMYWPDGSAPLKEAIAASGEPILSLTDWILADAEPEGTRAADVNEQRFVRNKFRWAFAESWEEQDVDFVIGPAFVGPASAHDTAFYWTYTSLYNLVDYPGAVFPTPIKAETGERYADDYQPLSEECSRVKDLWEASNFEDAPINLQIIARRFHDNQLFGALSILKDVLSLP